MTEARLASIIAALEESSSPNFNDRSYPQYVAYINAFLEHLGRERVYLVGSTTENLKVRWSKDAGDADFLLLSGRLEVPVTDVEFRQDTPCYIWVKVDQDKAPVELIDDRYLPSDVLRSVGPELFTALRGIYLLFTSSTSYNARGKQTTKYGLSSKVGLAVNEYRGLKIGGEPLTETPCLTKKRVLTRNEEFKAYINRRRREIGFYKQDVEVVERVVEFISCMKIPGTVGIGLGHWDHFSYIASLLLERLKESEQLERSSESDGVDIEDDTVTFENDFEYIPDDSPFPAGKPSKSASSGNMGAQQSTKRVHATYTEITCKDFVPAVRLVGELECMEAWRRAGHHWLSPGEVESISRLDVFFVARYAPVNPSRKDFCLSFTLAENKLAQCLSPVHRKLVLIMKALLKGHFARRHKQKGHVMRLTTFHMKTVIYRLCDVTEPSLWSEVNITASLTRVLNYLKTALQKKELVHYFMPSNLFAGFENEDFEILLECTEETLADPAGCLHAFLELDDGQPVDLWLTEAEADYLMRMSADGGISEELDRVEEFFIEVLRGMKEAPRNAQGNAPIREVITTVLDLFFRDEAQINFRQDSFDLRMTPRKSNTSKLLAGLGPLVAQLVSGVLKAPVDQSLPEAFEKALFTSQSEAEKQEAFAELKYILVTYFSQSIFHVPRY